MSSPESSSPSPNPSRRVVPRISGNHPMSPNTDSSPNTAENVPIPDEDQGAELPLTMSASIVLSSLPRDAHQALTDVEAIDEGRGKPICWSFFFFFFLSRFCCLIIRIVTVRFHPLPSAPILKSRVFKISASQKFETVVKFLRKKLKCKESDSVFCYVNSVFAPSLDEGVGGLWRVCHYVVAVVIVVKSS